MFEAAMSALGISIGTLVLSLILFRLFVKKVKRIIMPFKLNIIQKELNDVKKKQERLEVEYYKALTMNDNLMKSIKKVHIQPKEEKIKVKVK